LVSSFFKQQQLLLKKMKDVKHQAAVRMSKLGTETAFAVSLEAAQVAETGKRIFPFHIGDLDFESPDFVVRAMNKAIAARRTGYCPGAGIMPLRKRLAEVIGEERGVHYSADNVSVQSGGKPVIMKFLASVMEEGDEVLYPSPGYPIYESQIRYLGGVLKPYSFIETENGFVLDLEGLRRQITSNTKILVYNNYQNPMGIASSDEEMLEIAKIANEHDLLVLSDEAYFNIIYENVKGKSIVALPGMHERTLILYTYSKSWSMTGWRLGAAIGPQWIINLINKLNTNDESCTTHFIQWAGVECLSEEGRKFTAEIVRKLQERRDVLVEAINQVPGFHCHPSPAAFYLFVNVTQAMEMLDISEYEDFRRCILDATGVAFCTREHFGASLPGESQKYVRFAYSGIGVKDIQEAARLLKNFMQDVQKKRASTA